MTRNRIIWFCLWVLSIVGISLRGGAVTYGFFTVLTLVPVFSALYLLAVYALFHIYQELENRYASVNEPVRYHFALVNEYPLQFVSIRVRFFSSFSSITDLDDATEYELKPKSRIEKKTRLICRYRGEYEVGIKEIEIEDYFRLFRIRYKNKECIHAVVRPQLIRTDSLGEIGLSDALLESVRSKSEPDILSREYVPGDDPRLINWIQSARTGNLMTRLFTGLVHQEIAVITDTCRCGTEQNEFLPTENKLLEVVLAVAYYFSSNQISVAEYHLGQELMRVSAESTWKFEEFYDQIAAISFSSLHTHQLLYETAVQRRDLFSSSAVFMIAVSWDTAMEALLTELQNAGMHIIICMIGGHEAACPDISGLPHCDLIRIPPDWDLTRGMGE